MREIRLTETELIKTIKKIISENDDYVVGISASEKTELIDDVINRLSEFGMQYKIELNRLNSKFNLSTKPISNKFPPTTIIFENRPYFIK